MRASPRYLLVIDNEPDFLQFMTELMQDEGHRVETADSPESARARLNEKRPDLVISNLLIWGDDPVQVAEMLASDRQLAGIPLLICSSTPEALDAVHRLRRTEGLTALSKPFTIESLLEAIERLFDTGDQLGLSGSSFD